MFQGQRDFTHSKAGHGSTPYALDCSIGLSHQRQRGGELLPVDLCCRVHTEGEAGVPDYSCRRRLLWLTVSAEPGPARSGRVKRREPLFRLWPPANGLQGLGWKSVTLSTIFSFAAARNLFAPGVAFATLVLLKTVTDYVCFLFS